jgi:hypothetical protein
MTNLSISKNLKKYKCPKIYILYMIREYKIRDNVIVRIDKSQAEVIVDNKHKLFLTLITDAVIVKYNDMTLSIVFDKFNSEELTKKIHTITKQSHRFSRTLIKEVLELIVIDNLYNGIIEEIKELKEKKDINKLRKVYDYLSRMG